MSTWARQTPPQLLVRRLSAGARRGVLACGTLQFACALGRGGSKALKREGDGATPLGRYAVREVLFNPKAQRRPRTGLPVRAIAPCDGWCDAVADRNYNRPVSHPYPASAERLWRDDGVYDLVVVLDYNIRPRRRNLGSAIFMHVARPGFLPTEGCIALSRADLLKILRVVRRGSMVDTRGA